MAENEVANKENQFMTLIEVTQLLGVHRNTVYNLMNTDETFPKPYALSALMGKRGRKNYRFDRGELLEWVKTKRVT